MLVDQHAYIDLRPFREQGIDARYINMFDYRDVVNHLAPGKSYAVVFGRGTPADGIWDGHWDAGLKRAYGTYQNWLMSLAVQKHYPGVRHPLLSIQLTANTTTVTTISAMDDIGVW